MDLVDKLNDWWYVNYLYTDFKKLSIEFYQIEIRNSLISNYNLLDKTKTTSYLIQKDLDLTLKNRELKNRFRDILWSESDYKKSSKDFTLFKYSATLMLVGFCFYKDN